MNSEVISQLNGLIGQAKLDYSKLGELVTVYSEFATQSQLDLIVKYGQQIAEVCSVWEDEHEVVKGIKQLCMGLTNYYSTKFSEVEKPCLEAIRLLENTIHKDLYGLASMIYGANCRSLGKLDIAVKYLIQAANAISDTGDLAIYNSYSNYQLAEINNFIKDFESAEMYYTKAVEITDRLDSLNGKFRTYNGIANFYLATGQFDLCKKYLDLSLDIPELSASQKSRSSCDLGIYYYQIGDLDSSEKILQENYQVRKEANLEDASSTSLIALAKTQIDLGKTNQAITNLNTALAITEKYNSKSKMLSCYQLLAEAYKVEKQWENSVDAYAKYNTLQDEQVESQLKNIYQIKNNQISEQKQTIENILTEVQDSIRYAKRIQTAILPPDSLMSEYLSNSFVLYKPKDIVAGDFYWLEHKNDKVLFAAADCTGHGVPGAMVSVVCNNGLNRSVREYNLTNPSKILDKTREIVVAEFEKSEEEVKDGMDIALCSLEGNTLNYAGAHNPLWIIRKDAEEIEEIKADKQPIGKSDQPKPYTTHKVELKKGDTVYIFSDGYADQFGGEKGKKMKTANFKKLLLSVKNESLQKQKELIDQAFEDWKGNLEQLDDVCVIGVRV